MDPLIECRTCHQKRHKTLVSQCGICKMCEPLVWCCYVCDTVIARPTKYYERCEKQPYWTCKTCLQILPTSVPTCIFCAPKWKCYKCQRWEPAENTVCTYCRLQEVWTCYSCHRQFTAVSKQCPYCTNSTRGNPY